jgi:hypothetical protein
MTVEGGSGKKLNEGAPWFMVSEVFTIFQSIEL